MQHSLGAVKCLCAVTALKPTTALNETCKLVVATGTGWRLQVELPGGIQWTAIAPFLFPPLYSTS